MQNKPVALVTGVNRGIGQQIAKDLTAHGFIVLVGSRDLERGEAAATEIGGDARALQLDVTDEASITAATERVRNDFGRLDVLVNNAGISFVGDPSTPLEERAKSGLMTVVPLGNVRRIFASRPTSLASSRSRRRCFLSSAKRRQRASSTWEAPAVH